MTSRTPTAAKSPAARSRASTRSARLSFHPLTPDRWSDLEALFGPRGACGGCWCMAWRLARSDFARRKGDGNRRALRALVTKGEPTGILAYEGAEPIGWCAVAPREATPRLERSRVLARLDDAPVWSVTCFFVARGHRKQGVTVALLGAAAVHARRAGARILEGYPVEPREGELPAAFAWTGLASAFREAGFAEAARRSATRPIFRLTLSKGAAAWAVVARPAKGNSRGVMPQFLYRVEPTRPEMLTKGLTPEEEAAITEHFHYLVRLADAGVVHLFGRTLNADSSSFGLCIFEAADEPRARAIMEGDPAVRAGVMRAELFPYRIAGVGRGLRGVSR